MTGILQEKGAVTMMNERASTGIPGLDQILDDLRLGDNVVWQVDDIDGYRHFVQPFVDRAVKEGRRMVYIRFGQHPPVVEECPEVVVYQLDANQGFENFSAQVHAIATQEGIGVYYVFDSLSELLSVWATDLMIGNFFRVTCPYLFELNTIAYFAVLRNRNSHHTIARIRETTQLMLDVYRREARYYVHPLKVWNRYSPTMFLPHVGMEEQYVPITSSLEAARLFARHQAAGPGMAGRKLDYWDRVIIRAEEMAQQIDGGESINLGKLAEMIDQLCRMMIGREEQVLEMARQYFSLKDLLLIKDHLIGTGYIGGKTVGMLLARNILREDTGYNWRQWMEPHDSFYIGSDVYYTYLVENGCWHLLLKQKQAEEDEEAFFGIAAELREQILNGKLPGAVQDQFVEMLDYYGQAPIIVRSSSLLEDSFGNAFAGKYESVFCVNQGDPARRYQVFEEAVKTVYASTMSEDALTYRRQRGLAGHEEQMALLVQRVSGAHHNKYYFPDLAGVAMSRNLYVWRNDMDAHAGMMRLVFGLGTRAVDRVEDDYPRTVALDQPLLRPESTFDDKRRFSQRKVDVLDVYANELRVIPLAEVFPNRAEIRCWNMIAVRDAEGARRLMELGYGSKEEWVLTFEELLGKTAFPHLMRKMLDTLETAYQYPVDVEFTVNFDLDGTAHCNLLQCRPLQTGRMAKKNASLLAGQVKETIFSTNSSFMGGEGLEAVKHVVYIDSDAYAALSQSEKYQVARLVGKINRLFADRGQDPFILLGPGRWGTSTPSLGVPVSFAEICNALALVEIAGMKEGYMPEVSFGTHFFQDLVETHIFYVALFPGREGIQFNQMWFDKAPNEFCRYFPDQSEWAAVIKMIDTEQPLVIDVDLSAQKAACYVQEERKSSSR